MIEMYIIGAILVAVFNKGDSPKSCFRWTVIGCIPVINVILGFLLMFNFIIEEY